jgi:hypothetical protein
MKQLCTCHEDLSLAQGIAPPPQAAELLSKNQAFARYQTGPAMDARIQRAHTDVALPEKSTDSV